MYTLDGIICFVEEKTGANNVRQSDDIYNDLGCVGDDFHELIEAYAEKYTVDMSSYLQYFHADEEGGWNSIGGIFIKAPYKRVKRIPVTPLLLLDFAHKRKWTIDYPEHNLPIRRYDILSNQFLVIILITYAFTLALKNKAPEPILNLKALISNDY